MTVTIDWTLPTQRVDNTALPVGEIAFTRFSLSKDGGAFAQLADVPAPTSETALTVALVPGNYVIRALVYDTQKPPKVSVPTDTAFVIAEPVKAAPKPVTNQTAVVN